ncbi:MAG TPA: helix-turn-helix domain-containing protein, partial [Pseudonocardia sp.]|nr:helix-turn-helix domain-containing protein [Pseudonocardia sp.]
MVERIIDAATRVLSEHGYDGASTNRIAATAGISSGSLYQYFPNKDAIVTAVLERFSDQLVARIDAQLAAAMSM